MAAQGRFESELTDALKGAEIPTRDKAGVQLARRYAQLLDASRGRDEEASVLSDLGPKFLATLTALGLTVAGRGVASAKGGAPDAGAGGIDELRKRRDQRRTAR